MNVTDYPYDPLENVPLYEDPYGRPITWLLKSILKYGRVHLIRDIPIPQDVKILVSSAIGFCDNPKTALDLQKYIEIFPPNPSKRRLVFPVQLLDTTSQYISSYMRDSTECEQFIIVHHLGTSSWIVFLVMMSTRVIEQYTMGDFDHSFLNSLTEKLQNHIQLILGGHQFRSNHRLHVPSTFEVNPIIMGFSIVHYLHRHGRYLDISPLNLLKFQCTHLRTIIRRHDEWLGHLHIDGLSILAQSFVVHAIKDPPEFPELWKLGWAVVDVFGDGNCGYYVLMLGLQNNQNSTYSVYNRATSTGWKTKTMQLRRLLQNQSRLLLSTEYGPETRIEKYQDFWFQFSVGYDSDDAFDQLTESFVHPTLSEDLYFNDYFREHCFEYHMDPFWGPHVFSFTFGIRVIVIARETNYEIVPLESNATTESKKRKQVTNSNATKVSNKNFDSKPRASRTPKQKPESKAKTTRIASKKSAPKTKATRNSKKKQESDVPRTRTILRYSWSTTIYDFNKPLFNRIEKRNGIHRLSDVEFKRTPTIELVYQYGWKGVGKDGIPIRDDHHFQFLRRVIYDELPISADPSTTTLQKCLEERLTTTEQDRGQIQVNHATTTTETEISTPNRRRSGRTSNKTSKCPAQHDLATHTSESPVNNEANIESTLTTVTGNETFNDTSFVRSKTSTCSIQQDLGTPPVEIPVNEQVVPTTEDSNSLNDTISKRLAGKVFRKMKARRLATLTKLYRKHQSLQDHDPCLKKLTKSRMLYDPDSSEFYVKDWDDDLNDFGEPKKVVDEDEYNDELAMAAIDFAGEWMGPNIKPTIGDARDGLPPPFMSTEVRIPYQQLNQRYCLAYSMANALFYCNFVEQAQWLHDCAPALSTMDFELALAELRQKMMDFVPIIGLPTIFGRKTKRHNKFQRNVSWDDLFKDLSPFPTLVIPELPTGERTHAFCIVDDLIFDSVAPFALPLNMESVRWIFNDVEPTIHLVLRFNMKVSPPKGKGPKIKGRYDRHVVYHWDHPNRPKV